MENLTTNIVNALDPLLYDDMEKKVAQISTNDETAFIPVFEELEQRVKCLEYSTDIMKATLAVLSGKILLQAKALVGHGKWQYIAHDMFPLQESERNIRMKAASIVDIEKYLFLGWKRISILARAFKTSKINNPFKTIIDITNYKIDIYNPDDIEFFCNLVNGYVAWNLFDTKLKSKVTIMQVVDAVESGVKLDKSLINTLSKQKSPSTTLANMTYHSTGNLNHSPSGINVTSNKRNLATHLHALVDIGKSITDFKDNYLSKIPLELLGSAHDTIVDLKELREMNKLFVV